MTESTTLEMMTLDMREAADGAVDIYGVQQGGASVLLRVRNFRNFFYVQLSECTPDVTPEAPHAGVGNATSVDDDAAKAVAAALASDSELKLGARAALEIEVHAVRRMPLLACYSRLSAGAALPTSDDGLRVRMLKITFSSRVKAKAVEEALNRAAKLGDSATRRLLALDGGDKVLCYGRELAPVRT